MGVYKINNRTYELENIKIKIKPKTSFLYNLHPYTALLYFFIFYFIVFAVINPLIRITCFAISCIISIYYGSIKKFIRNIKFTLPICFIFGLINFLLVNRGRTIIFYLFNKPFTLESLFYSISIFLMISTIFISANIFNFIFNNTKVLFVLSRLVPRFAFLCTLSLSIFEDLKFRAIEIKEALSFRCENTNKFKTGLTFLQQFFVYTLEDGMSISEYLKVKKYGNKKRTFYELFVFHKEDLIFFLFSIIFFIIFIIIMNIGLVDFTFYPTINGVLSIPISILIFLYLLIPIFIDMVVYLWR